MSLVVHPFPSSALPSQSRAGFRLRCLLELLAWQPRKQSSPMRCALWAGLWPCGQERRLQERAISACLRARATISCAHRRLYLPLASRLLRRSNSRAASWRGSHRPLDMGLEVEKRLHCSYLLTFRWSTRRQSLFRRTSPGPKSKGKGMDREREREKKRMREEINPGPSLAAGLVTAIALSYLS